MGARLFAFTFTMIFVCLPGVGAPAEGTNSGREIYVKYCAACHGVDGTGNGAVARDLTVKPADLTVIRKNNKGVFPLDDVMSSIDGRREVRGHGDREMPVWGEVFSKQAGKQKYTELTTLLTAKIIAEYVSTLQK